MFANMKPFIDKHVGHLNLLLSLPPGVLPQETLASLEDVTPDAQFISEGIYFFAIKCREEPERIVHVVKEFDEELDLCLRLCKKFSDGKKDLRNFPKEVPIFLFMLKMKFYGLQKQLREETGYKPRESKMVTKPKPAAGSHFYDASTGVSVQLSGGPRPAFVQPPVSPRVNVQPVPPAEVQLQLPKEVREPFLPSSLEMLGLKPKEREVFLKVIDYLATHMLEFKERVYVCFLADLDKILNRYTSKKELDKIITKICKGEGKDADSREAQGYRCLYRNPESRERERYKLEQEYPELKQEIEALLR